MKIYFTLLSSLLLFITACDKDDCHQEEPETYPIIRIYTGVNIYSVDCSGDYRRIVSADTLLITQPNEDSLYITSTTGENELRLAKASDNGTVKKYIESEWVSTSCFLIAPDSIYFIATAENISPLDPQCDLRRDTSLFAGSAVTQ